AGLGEERPELDEPGVDEQRARRGQRDDRALQRERIGQLRANVLERVAPARHMLEDVPHAEAASAAVGTGVALKAAAAVTAGLVIGGAGYEGVHHVTLHSTKPSAASTPITPTRKTTAATSHGQI